MWLRATIIFSLISLISLNSNAQNKKEPDFHPPLDLTPVLSGTFGELRSNHFHSGIDFKTQQVEGKIVYAIEEGYVSRIKVSPWGYGKALYVTHPNGYTSVYGHLQRFNPEIEEYIKAYQYAQQQYAVDKYLMPDEIKLSKGDTIAISGNTGGSMGPHLHFEIRKTATQNPVNPMQFGFGPKDDRPPTILGLGIYPAEENTLSILGKNGYFPDIQGKAPEYKVPDTIKLYGQCYLGIKTYDQLNGAANKNGVYAVKLFIDSNLVYHHSMDELSFSTTRYINSLIDYAGYVNDKGRYQKTWKQSNNKLKIYHKQKNGGIYRFTDGKAHQIEYQVSDFSGNKSKLSFILLSDTSMANQEFLKDSLDFLLIYPEQPFRFKEDKVGFSAPTYAFYDTVHFTFSIDSACTNCLEPQYKIHRPGTPIHKRCILKMESNIADSLKKKTFLVRKVDDKWIYVGGKWKGKIIEDRIRSFGTYSLMMDSIAPEISIFHAKSDSLNLNPNKKLIVRLKDDMSGIKEYRGELNGHWILMEYDPKKERLSYEPDKFFNKGINHFIFRAEDLCGNKSEIKAVIIKTDE